MDIFALSAQCAPAVHPTTMAAIVQVESGGNPFAIGVVGGELERQPRQLEEAVATARSLAAAGYNFSLGLSQVNRYNLAKFGLDYRSGFDACSNLHAGASILVECFATARLRGGDEQDALRRSFSCYYSGNFSTGFRPDFKGQPSYVAKVLSSAGAAEERVSATPIRVIRTATPSGAASASVGGGAELTTGQADDDEVMVFRSTPSTTGGRRQ